MSHKNKNLSSRISPLKYSNSIYLLIIAEGINLAYVIVKSYVCIDYFASGHKVDFRRVLGVTMMSV